MAVRRPVTSRSTITSSICERPVSSHRIRLLVPAARPSTTTSVREVARVSITAGLLDRTRVIGVCTLTTTDLPTRMWSACPSEGAGTCCGGWSGRRCRCWRSRGHGLRRAGSGVCRLQEPVVPRRSTRLVTTRTEPPGPQSLLLWNYSLSCPHRFRPLLRRTRSIECRSLRTSLRSA